jgi:hypothetical protein
MTDHREPCRSRISLGVLAWAALSAALAGCSEPLFPESEDRSQFAGYDRARDQLVPPYVEDEFGRRHPNLRGRLLTHD